MNYRISRFVQNLLKRPAPCSAVLTSNSTTTQPTKSHFRFAVLGVAAVVVLLILGSTPAHASWVSGSQTYPTASAFCGAFWASLPGGGLQGSTYQDMGMVLSQSPGGTIVVCNAIVFYPPGHNPPYADLSAQASPACTGGLVGDVNAPGGCSPSSDVQAAKDIGKCHVGAEQCGDPIDIGSGNVFEEATDYETAGQNKLQFRRYYNSRGGYSGILSTWRSTYDRFLYIGYFGSGTAAAQRADGHLVPFHVSGSGWVCDTDEDYTLFSSDGTNWTVTTPSDALETYVGSNNVANRAYLTSITARNGYAQTLNYGGVEQLQSVTDSYNRTLTFSYNSSSQLQTLGTPDSEIVTYGYTSNSAGTLLTSVSYNTTPATGVTYNYGENSAPSSALTSVIDENGNLYKSWKYDAYGRGLTSAMGGPSVNADSTTITYNDTTGTRNVTNAFGVTDTYTFSTLHNAPKVSQISRAATTTTAAATRNFIYDNYGYLASQTDWNGSQTTYANDLHGQPMTIVEAVGKPESRTTTISYDPTFVHLLHQVITAGLTSGFPADSPLTITYVYDSSGNLHTRTDTDTTTQSVPYSTRGQTRTWTYTYNNFLLASVQNPRTDVTAITNYGYGSDGALTSITDALTHATNITSHTGGGRPLTIVDPNSVTTTLTYDARQRLTSSAVTTSAGTLTTTYTIDPASELTKVTLPDSSFLAYQPGVQVVDFLQVGRRSRLRDLTALGNGRGDSASAKALLIYPTREE